MIINASVVELRSILSADEVARVVANARVADAIEQAWKSKLDALLRYLVESTVDRSLTAGELQVDDRIEQRFGAFLLEHELATTRAAAATVTSPEGNVRAARAPRWPTSAARINDLWQRWKSKGELPGRTKKQAARIKRVFIRKMQELWQKYGDDFIAGDSRKGYLNNPRAFSREYAVEKIQEQLGIARSHARTIVETETTRYYNSTRKEAYDAMPNVAGYLFVCIRDHRTTAWCKSRGGAVFTQGTTLLKRNTPPCHWNCRSELLPLSRNNPVHLKLLKNESLWAENRVLVPLPPGWEPLAA